MSRRRFFPFLGLLLAGGLAVGVDAQQQPSPVNVAAPGALHLQAYAPGTYPGDPDNWSIATDSIGTVYVGNGAGVFTLSGPHLSGVIPTANESVVRAVERGPDGRIYVGGSNELGYLEPDAGGYLRYVSLLDHVAPAQRNFRDVWYAETFGDEVFFYTYQQIMRWSPGQQAMRTWTFDGMVVLVAGGREPLLQDLTSGTLSQLRGDAWEEVMRDPLLAKEPLRLVVTQPSGDSLAITGRSFYRIEGGRTRPLPSPFEGLDGTPWIYDALQLPGGSLALGTLYHGVIFVDAQGRFVRQLTKADGLPDAVVLALAYDARGHLWLSHERGLTRVDLGSGVTHFGESEGLFAEAFDVAAYGGATYVAGLQQLGRIAPQPGARIDVISDPFEDLLRLEATPQGLLVGSNKTLRLYRDGRLQNVPGYAIPGDYPDTFLRSRLDTTRLYVGFRSGLAVLALRNGRWTFQETLPQVQVGVTAIAEASDGSLWLGTDHENLHKLVFTAAGPSLTEYGAQQGMPRLAVTPFRLGDEILVYTPRGFFRPQEGRIVRDSSALAALFDYAAVDVEDLQVDARGDVWMVVDDVPGVARRFGDAYRWEPLRDRVVRSGISNGIRAVGDVVWVLQTNRLVRMGPAPAPAPFATHLVSIRHLRADSVIFAGFGRPGVARLEPQGGLAFAVSAPHFDHVEYRYRLDGLDGEWTEWTDRAQHEYRTLPAGRYVFRAQARDRFGNEGREATYAFQVPAPWYATRLAGVFYGLLVLLVVGASGWLAMRWQRRRLETSRRALEREVELRTREADAQKKMLQHLNTTLRASNERLQELSEQKSHLLSIAAHDLKAPLSNIYSLADILLEEQGSAEPNYEFIELIQRTARDMSNLIENVLTSAASEMGQVGLQCVVTDLGALAERAVEQCVGMAERKGQRLTFTPRLSTGSFHIVGDELRIVEAMTNLVSNAIKYSPLEGQIAVGVERNADWVYFRVDDTGPGLSEEDREFLFQPFQRLSAQPTSGESSSGLGLYIVRQYIEMHGGIVGAESLPGQGSTFWFCLPVVSGGVSVAASSVDAVPENQV